MLALWVILHHLTGPGQSLEPAARAMGPAAYSLIRGGYLAVTTFFVLSGFVLARTYSEQRWDTRGTLRYSAGRIARVYPIYLVSLVVIAPFIVADTTPGRNFYAAAHLLLLQGWLGHIPVQWNTPAWSLSCEMFFYLSFPIAAAFMRRASWTRTIALAVAAFLMTRVLMLAGVSDEVKPLVHLSDFLMGIAAAAAYARIAESPKSPRGPWLYLPALAAAAALIAWPALLPGGLDLNTALRPLNAVSLIGLALGGGIVARALSTPVAVFLGKASYAMYILHIPIIWWYLRFARTFSAALYLALVIAISAAVYFFVEEPANRWLRARLQRALQA